MFLTAEQGLFAGLQYIVDNGHAGGGAVAALLNAGNKGQGQLRICHEAGEGGIGFFLSAYLTGAGFGADRKFQLPYLPETLYAMYSCRVLAVVMDMILPFSVTSAL